MTNDEGFTSTYLAQSDSREWPDQLPIHGPTYGHMLQIDQRIHLLHIQAEEPPIANLAKPFVMPVIKGNLILLNRVIKEEVGLSQ